MINLFSKVLPDKRKKTRYLALAEETHDDFICFSLITKTLAEFITYFKKTDRYAFHENYLNYTKKMLEEQ
jgi:hypothetical protein